MARAGFKPDWEQEGEWQVLPETPVDASITTRRILDIAMSIDGVVVLNSHKYPSLLRIRYSDPPYALMTIRSFDRQDPKVTITPRLRDRAFEKAFEKTFPEAHAKAWKPGKTPWSAEPRYVGEPTGLVAEIEKILPRMVCQILTRKQSKHSTSI